jgi:pimeloyl-ACP methyl ester carboxylesterase
VVKDTWEVPTEEEIDPEEAKSGDVIKTRVRDTNLELRSRGSGLPLLVLPEYGYEKDYLETYLRNLEDTNQILYVSLPGASDFPNLPNAPGMPYPYYPLELLVDAFEDLHKELVENKQIENKPFAIMAHGLSCWIAMKYAAKYPKRVRRMILIAPTSGGKAWGEGRDRVERQGQQEGDLEMEHYAQGQVYENGAPRYQAQSDEESAALMRKGHTLYFADTRDLEIGRIYGPVVEKRVGDGMFRGPAAFRPMGSITIPDFSLFKEPRSQTQTIIMLGAHSTRLSKDDCEAIAKHYRPAAKVLTFPRSSRMPFIEENERFVNTVRKLLGGRRR